MNIKYLIDENQRGVLWHVIQKHNARGIDTFDAVRVGDPLDLPLSSNDDRIIEWCAQNDRVLVTFDKRTMPDSFNKWLGEGHSHPGLFVLRRHDIPVPTLGFLVAAAHASSNEE